MENMHKERSTSHHGNQSAANLYYYYINFSFLKKPKKKTLNCYVCFLFFFVFCFYGVKKILAHGMAHCPVRHGFTSVCWPASIFQFFSFFLPFVHSVVIRFTHTLVVFFLPHFTPFRSEIRNNEIFFSSLRVVSPPFSPQLNKGENVVF